MNTTWPRVLPVGDLAVTVQLGSSLDEETVGRVRALDDRLRDRGLEGVEETVPSYASLLVFYDRKRLPFVELERHLLGLCSDLRGSTGPGRLIELPALYEGEDLDEVAATCGVPASAVVDLHASREYRVLMLGFSPGFAYMGFVDERLRVPRRKTPRTRVPEGAIAIAGPQTGVYPRSLPGGWNLLGRTSLRLFDASRANPSTLMPGDRVRFAPTKTLPPTESLSTTAYDGAGVRVLTPGILTTIQDAGRRGLRRLAVPLSGVADTESARRANRCVGNPLDALLIEICGPGLRLSFERPTYVAISGAHVTAHLERGDLEGGLMAFPMNGAVRVRPSNVLEVTSVQDGNRAYVAIAGLDAPRVLGSASADLGSGFLRPLEPGDGLTLGPVDADRVPREGSEAAPRRASIRVILGPQIDHFDAETIETFFATAWRTGLDSDRVGARLDGVRLRHAGPAEIVSDGMAPGCIQVPPDGRPIVMLKDCPTTGGYPKIGCVVSEDLGLLAQAIPGRTEIRFSVTRIEDL
jgi:KipI family sensor histidine kinase inhibitor